MVPELDYATYVWSSYGLFAAIIAWQVLQPILKRRRLIEEIREEQALQAGDYDS